MKSKRIPLVFCLSTLAVSVCLLAPASPAQTEDAWFNGMKANKILFLGNSITLHGPYIDWSDEANWGMAASAADKDYVHLLASAIAARTGKPLQIVPAPKDLPRWYPGNELPAFGDANVINIADIFERNYATWDNVRIQRQIAAKPDIVVLQFGENMTGGTHAQFKTALETLLTGLKDSSNPHIFITSSILGTQEDIDEIKRQVCAEDPTHRVFVDLTGIVDHSGAAGHPGDAGMKTIADTIFAAMENHAVPEPQALSVGITGLIGMSLWFAFASNRR